MNSKSDDEPQSELQELLQKRAPPTPCVLASAPERGKRAARPAIIAGQTSQEASKVTQEDDGPDVVSVAIGDYGHYQLLVTFLLSLFSLPCTFHIYLPTFTGQETKFWCAKPEYLAELSVDEWITYSQPVSPCEVRVLPPDITSKSVLNATARKINQFQKCTKFEYDFNSTGKTIISEWDLVCDQAYLINLAEVMFLVGVGIGGVVGGYISDKFGRKRVLMSMMLTQSALALLSLLVKSYTQYVILRLFMGLVSVSVVYAAFVLAVEIVGGKWVTISGVCVFFPLPIAYIIVSVVSLVLKNWRDLQLSLSIPGCLLLSLWCFIPESPRWLISTGKIQEAKALLTKISKFNKSELPSDLDKMLMISKAENKDNHVKVLQIFQSPLLKRTSCLAVVWFAVTIGYYGLLLNIGKFHMGNLHTTSIILAVVEIPAIALSIFILLKAGRRIPIFITILVCGLAVIASELIAISFNIRWLMLACLMVGKFAIGTTNMMMPIFTAELYPTILRNLGVGASQISSGLALICIPYLWTLANLNIHLPMVTIAALCALGAGIVLLLPDTGRVKVKSDHKRPKLGGESQYNGNNLTITEDKGH